MEHPELQEAFLEISRKRRSRRRIYSLLQAYSWLGIGMAVLSLAFFLVSMMPVKLTSDQQLALIFGGVGLMLSLMSRVLIMLRKERELEEIDSQKENLALYSFLDTWTRVEKASKAIVKKSDEDFNVNSISAVIHKLNNLEVISDGEVMTLERSLQLRNAIAHGGGESMIQEVELFAESLNSLFQKISWRV